MTNIPVVSTLVDNARSNPAPAWAGLAFAVVLIWNPILAPLLARVLKIEVPALDEGTRDVLLGIVGGAGALTLRQANKSSEQQQALKSAEETKAEEIAKLEAQLKTLKETKP